MISLTIIMTVLIHVNVILSLACESAFLAQTSPFIFSKKECIVTARVCCHVICTFFQIYSIPIQIKNPYVARSITDLYAGSLLD